MQAKLLCTVTAAALLSSTTAQADKQVPVDAILAMMDTVPSAPGNPRSTAYRWSRKPSAPAVAHAIARVAPDREWAARMVVYAIHESGLSACASGDGGKSLGTWQLQGVSTETACDPQKAAPVWLAMARRSMADCSALPPAERLAELVSGSCERGRRLARDREVLVLGALASDAESPPVGVE
jgi:hypothetical protein